MKVRELLAFLATCDPDAEVIPDNGSMSHYIPAFKAVRESRAMETTKQNPMYSYRPGVDKTITRYLEMPTTGKTKVVVLI